MFRSVLVVGSSNTDMVVVTPRLPRLGETVLGGTLFMNPGGKGANQAVAIARMGVKVAFISKTGSDIFGHQFQQMFMEEGIDASCVFTDLNHPSGVALISVDNKGQNTIIVASGANAYLSIDDARQADELIQSCSMVLMQLEIPIETVMYVAERAYELGKPVVLNPAPAIDLPLSLLEKLYLITPNETEAESISGITIIDEETAKQAAMCICKRGVKHVIITLGEKGAFVYSENQTGGLVPSFKVDVKDTTAAGDVFNGALVAALIEGRSLMQATEFACKASAISVTRSGAQVSVPYRREVDVFFQKL